MSCLTRRQKIIIGVVVAIVYASAVAAFAVQRIYATACGWLTALLMELVWLRLVLLGNEAVRASVFGTVPALYLFTLICLTAAAAGVYFLQLAIRDHEPLNMNSQYLTFVAFIMALKWCLYVPVVICRARKEGKDALLLAAESNGLINGKAGGGDGPTCPFAHKARQVEEP